MTWALMLATLRGRELPPLPAIPGRRHEIRDEPLPPELIDELLAERAAPSTIAAQARVSIEVARAWLAAGRRTGSDETSSAKACAETPSPACGPVVLRDVRQSEQAPGAQIPVQKKGPSTRDGKPSFCAPPPRARARERITTGAAEGPSRRKVNMNTTLDTHPAQPPKQFTRYGVPVSATPEQKVIAALRSTGREVLPRLVNGSPQGGYRVADLKGYTEAADLAELEALARSLGLAPDELPAAPPHAFGAQRDSGQPN